MVMAYNEVASLEDVVREISAELERLGRRREILIVDDGSTDGTGDVADRLAASLPSVRVVHHRPNRGLGEVYRTGFDEARRERISFLPADGQFPASILSDFAPLLDPSDGAELVLGYLPERDDSRAGRVISWMERLVYALLFGRLPRFQGIFMIRRDVLSALPLVSSGRGWGIVMEMILRASRQRRRIVSVPTALRPRRSGASKVRNLRNIVENLRQLLSLRMKL